MQLPIGYDDFGEIIDKKLNFIDKSLFIKAVFDDETAKAIVITRPRRFGKTFNLSLLHYFLADEVRGKPTQGLFDKLNIADHATYMQHQGKYPVIAISFKDCKDSRFENAYKSLCVIIQDLYAEHDYLLSSDKLKEKDKAIFTAILKGGLVETEITLLKFSLKCLSQYLYQHHGVKPWLLIDEYDTLIQASYINQYYDQMIEFLSGLFCAALKNNPYLNKAVITGILRIAKESLFSGVNNLIVYSILNSNYSEHFGFTEIEVDNILAQSHLSEKAAEIKEWYNGYQIGDTTIYNPWSIANCIREKGTTKSYWINTSDNQLIKDLLKKSPLSFKKDFELLVMGNTIEKFIDEQMVFQYLNNNLEATWSLLLMAGYLKPAAYKETDQGILADLAVPNREVRNLYRQIIEQWLSNGYGIGWYNDFIASLLDGKIEIFKDHLEKVLLQIVSYHDVSKEPEAFYHGLLLGFMASLNQTHEIKSNREAGLSRFDILILPKDLTKTGVVIELKVKSEKETLTACASQALKQIEQKKYVEEFKQRGIEKVIQLGIGFEGKTFALDAKLPDMWHKEI